MDLKVLTEAGMDVETALERMMGNEVLLKRLVERFLEDENLQKLEGAFAAGDREAALGASHTLKGICGNLSFIVLFELFSRQVTLLREEKWEQAKDLMPEIAEAYKRLIEALQRGIE